MKPTLAALPDNYSAPVDLLKDRVVLVTGAGDGLGRATALAAARGGATVVLLGRTVRKLEAVYDEIHKQGLSSPAIYPLHLGGASWNDYGELAATLEREYGRLDGIVHCAVQFKQFQPMDDVAPQDWFESFQVNLNGPYALTRHCLPLLLKAPDASVVFVSDAPGRTPKAFAGSYGVAKAALENLSSTWAQELERYDNLRINTFNPGAMRSGVRLRGFPGATIDGLPSPETAAHKILWLLGSGSRGVSGQALG